MLLALADEYPAMRFRGDGEFSGGPILGYSLRMRPIPFYTPGEYVFHFSGMPDEEMTFWLEAEGKNRNDESALRVKTLMEEVLTNQKGQICRADGPPLERGQSDHGWDLVLAGEEAGYWNWDCGLVLFKPSESYTLTLRIREVDPRTPKVNLIPLFRSRGPYS